MLSEFNAELGLETMFSRSDYQMKCVTAQHSALSTQHSAPNLLSTQHSALSTKLRVVHVTLGLDMGGLEKLLVELARHANRERFDLHFISLGTRGCLADEIQDQGWPVIPLEEPSGLRPGLVLRLAKLLRQWKADIVHTHDNRPLVYGALAARLAAARRVFHSQHGQNLGVTARQAFLLNRAASLTDRYVCVSRDSAAVAIRQGVPARKIHVICNGIDTRRFDYTGPVANGPLVTVARLSPEKDVQTFLHATALAVREQPSLVVEIAGDGPCMPVLRQLAGTLCLARHVRFLGQIQDVASVLARASVFVLPSFSEGISLTLLEAMAVVFPPWRRLLAATPRW